LVKEGRIIEPLRKRILGRVTASPVIDPATKETIIGPNEEITEEIADTIEKTGVREIIIRSPLTCQAKSGLCQRCYGWDLGIHKLVSLGEAVGVIAAQSIGEPGTQLTLRTFHTGGIFHKGGDVAQGLPQITELFEPRKQSLSRRGIIRQRKGGEALISEIEGKVTIEEEDGRSFVKINGDGDKEITYEVGGDVLVSDGEMIEAGEKIIDGSINPRSLLRVKGARAAQEYLVNQTRQIYLSQGVNIDVKHFEVIVRQMMRKVEIEDPGDTDYLPGEQIDRVEFEEVNTKVKEKGGRPAMVRPILLSLPKAAQEDKTSFLSAAAFQRTKQILTEAAISGQEDFLRDLKGNVIIGKLIPAGTGFNRESRKPQGIPLRR